MALTDHALKTLYKVALGIAVTALIIYFAIAFFDLIVMIVISLLLALVFNPLVTFIETNGIPRFGAVLIVFAVCGIFIFIGLSVFIPKIINQMNLLTASLNEEKIASIMVQIEEALKNYIPFIDAKDITEQLSTSVSGAFINSIDNFSKIVSSIFSVAALVVIIPFMTFFLLKDKSKITKGIINIMPNRYFEVSYWVIKKISDKLAKFVSSWIFDAFMVGFLSAAGLTILGIQNSIIIGFIAGIGHLIPYFGPIIGGIPAIIISVIQFGDFSRLPSIFIMFILVYVIDNGFIQPNVFSKSTDLHPLVIIILILLGSQVMGVFGMLLAVPAATVIKTAAREIHYGYKNYKIIHH
ncbi:AI-2E family transporter [Bacteroidota bacterium]